MSGSPLTNSPAEFPQIAGHRRKRSQTPPPAIPGASSYIVGTPSTPLDQTPQSALSHSRSGYGGTPSQAGLYTPVYAPLPPPVTYGSSSSNVLPSTTGTAGPLYSSDQISPRATRKTKAHVASACINCKKKHLRCDNQRPCRRCVQSGKEDSCIDVEHKKRGRPPLKPDEPSSRRTYESAISPLSAHPTDPSRRYGTIEPSSFPPIQGFTRSFRPLQAVAPYEPNRSPIRSGRPLSMYAQPTIAPSHSMAMGQFITSSRPYSTIQPLPYPQSSAHYIGGGVEAQRPSAPYGGGYAYPPLQSQMGPPPPQPYSNPIFPRTSLPPPAPPSLEPAIGSMGPASLQLPPIRPTLVEGSVDPAISHYHSYHSSPEQQGSFIGTTRQPSAKRPKMDIQGILGPRSD